MRNFIKNLGSFLNIDLLFLVLCWGIMGVFYMHVSRVNAKMGAEESLTIKDVDNGQEKLRSMLGKEYDVFVKELGQNIDDPKFLAALNAGDRVLDKVEFDHNAEYRVCDLIPTQNEIDVDKSLKYPLLKESEETLEKYLEGKGGPFAPGGSPIITAGGKYIIDGHHRWSQLYLINTNAKIKAINIKIDDPQEALKVVQLAIASTSGKIPTALVEGKNLLTMSPTDFSKWIAGNISENAIKAFRKASFKGSDLSNEELKKTIADYIWQNVIQMRNENHPISKAPSRGLMPQTDSAKGWDKRLEAGEVNIR